LATLVRCQHVKLADTVHTRDTYLGRFIDHDITFDPASSLQQFNDPDALEDWPEGVGFLRANKKWLEGSLPLWTPAEEKLGPQ
jgi:hypothetical protein